MREFLEILEAPACEPVSLSAAKAWLRIDDADTNHDTVVNLLIAALRRDAENRTLRAFIPRTYRLSLEAWPQHARWGNAIELPSPPLISVSSVTYLDTNGARQTLAADQYDVHAEAEPGFIIPAYNVSWPSLRRRPDSVQVTFRAGYAPGSPDDEAGQQEVMPENLLLWMEAKIGTLFENRETIITGTIVNKIPHDLTDGLIDGLVIGNRLF